jgi:hypothetical protein
MAIDFLHHINLNQNQIKSVVIDNMTTTQRTTLGTDAIAGQVIYNTTTDQFQCFNGKAWISLGDKLTIAEVTAALSVTDAGGDGSLSYNDATGVFTYTGPSATEVRAHFSQGTGITVTDGEIATTITQYTDADVQAYISGGTGVDVSAAGEISIGQAVGTSDNVGFGDIDSSGNVVIKGNLSVLGSTVSVNQTEVNVTNAFVFEGATADEFETTLSIAEPTADRKISLPDADGEIALTSQVRTDEQIEDLVGLMVGGTGATGSAQSGIAVSYDDVNGKLDFNVADPTITLTGDVTGSGTMSNLGDISIALDTVKNKAANGIFPENEAASTFTFTHGLETENVVVSLFIKKKMIYADVTIVDGKSVKVDFAKNVEKDSVTINVISAAS